MLRCVAALLLALMMQPALADDWGCQVALCLSNPNDPEAVDECKDSMNKLWEHLLKGEEKPGCALSDTGPGGGSVPNVGIEKGYDDDDDLEWVKVSVDGKVVKTLNK